MEGDLSIDRLEIRDVNLGVVKFLTPKGKSHARQRNTTFHGWALLCVKDLAVGVKGTAVKDGDNPYHAEIDRSAYTTGLAKRSFAFELCVHASKYDFVDKFEG